MKTNKKSDGKLTYKLLLCIIGIIIPMNLILVFASRQIYVTLEKQVLMSLQSTVNMFVNTLDLQMQQAERFVYSEFSSEGDFWELQNAKDEVEYKNARAKCHNILYQEANGNTNCSAFFFYLKNKDEFTFGGSDYLEMNELEQYLRINLTEPNGWICDTIEDKKFLIGIVKIGENYCGAFIDADEKSLEVKKSVDFNSALVSFMEKTEKTASDEVGVTGISEYGNFQVVLQVSEEELRGELPLWEKGIGISAVLSFLLLPLMYRLIHSLTLKPLQELNHAHYELETGNKNYRITEAGKSEEFNLAFESFNQMANNIYSLRLHNMKQELEKNRLQLNNLQLQIRPHFLLNMFKIIYNFTMDGNVDDIREVVLYLSDYFRGIFQHGNDLEYFSKEMMLIEEYIKVAKIRYQGFVEFSSQIDPDVYEIKIPPLLIHNFIENIISHAMIPGKTVHIMMSAEYADGIVTFVIGDDGSGMTVEEVERVNGEHFWESDERVHVGLKNSLERIRFFYGTDAEIYVESVVDEGTVFTVSFPCEKG